tara:strand:- start:1441 stop:1818 length:378 start_codon:yes stop_codon:yes gene_type:complete
MTFKLKLAIFSNTPEDHKRVYGEGYDPNKNYPKYSGNLQIPESELINFIDYLQKCKPDPNDFHGEPVVPIKVSGWLSESSQGKKYQALTIEPVYAKQKEIEESGSTDSASPSSPPPTKQEEDFPF